MERKRDAFNTCHVQKQFGIGFDPTQSCHGTPNINVLTMNNKYVTNPHANIVPKHKTMQQKIKNQCITYCNAWNSCGASPIMKHDGFQCGICERSFAHRALNHSIKFSHICQLVITQAIHTHVWWKSNAINVNRWYFTSLVPNMASIEISPLWPNWNIGLKLRRCLDPYVWIPFTSPTS
jgi:hypothetical protein